MPICGVQLNEDAFMYLGRLYIVVFNLIVWHHIWFKSLHMYQDVLINPNLGGRQWLQRERGQGLPGGRGLCRHQLRNSRSQCRDKVLQEWPQKTEHQWHLQQYLQREVWSISETLAIFGVINGHYTRLIKNTFPIMSSCKAKHDWR